MLVLLTNVEHAVTIGPSNDGLAVQAKLARPLGYGHLASSFRAGQKHVVAAVVLLGLCIGPSAVAGFVIPVIVDAVNGGAGAGPGSHIGVEAREVMPAFAHSDSSAAVVRKALVVGIAASVLHGGPSGVLAASLHPMLSASLASRNPHLATEAAAGLAAPTSKRVAPDGPRISALAVHGPLETIWTYDSPATENIAYLNAHRRNASSILG